MKRKWLIGLTALSLTIPLLMPGPAFADDIDKKKDAIEEREKEIQQLEKEKEEKEQDLQFLLADLEKRKRELTRLNQDVYETEQQLQKLEQDLEEKEKQLAERQRMFKQRIRTIYQQGEMFYVEALLNSNSFDEFVAKLEFIRQVSRRDRELIDGYEKESTALAQAKQEKEDLLAEQKEKGEQAQKLHDDLTAKYKKYEKEMSQLAHDQENLEEINESERKKVRELVRKRQLELERERKKKKASTASAVHDGGKFLWPVKGARLTSPYGMRYHPVRKENRMHTGIDLAAPIGTPIRAAATGSVIEARPAAGYGYIIVIDHGSGLSTLYAHMYPQGVKVRVGQQVSKGDVIAEVGNNGWSTGPHLHLEVLKNGNHTDPMPYFKR